MNKELFLQILEDGLRDFPSSELNDILYDYKEHFDVGFASGKSEEYIIEELGNPYDIVNQYRNGYLQKTTINNEEEIEETIKDNTPNTTRKRNNTIVSIIIITLSLIIFGPILIGFSAGAIGLIIGFIALTFAISIGGIGVLLGKVFTNTIGFIVFPSFILDFPNSALIWLVLGSISLMIFTLIVFYYFVKAMMILFKKAINWVSTNLKGGK